MRRARLSTSRIAERARAGAANMIRSGTMPGSRIDPRFAAA
jgi:hypothetical protein